MSGAKIRVGSAPRVLGFMGGASLYVVLAFVALSWCVTGCDFSRTETAPTEPPGPTNDSVVIGGSAKQNESKPEIVCEDNSIDPNSLVVEGGVRWRASKSGSAFSVTDFGS